MARRQITIVGLGFMGGSLGLALRKHGKRVRVYGVSRSPSKIREALSRKAIHKGTTSLREGVRDADLVVIATPVKIIAKTAREVDRFARKGAVVTDVGSTKLEILKALKGKSSLRRVEFIGSHPMCGSHEAGLKFARANLYSGARVFVVKNPAVNRRAFKTVCDLWKSVGAHVFSVSAKRHDSIAAEVSQLPHLLAAELVNHIHDRHLTRFVSTGFLDATRVAQGDPLLWQDIVLSNRGYLIQSLKSLSLRLKSLIKELKGGDGKKVYGRLSKACRTRRRLKNHCL